ncbi:hypothetical protein B0H21DRAFT_745377 [Amylocystis lapponica]|nr:hypothetical protein B0H21DRAFT_745377 [Amylocystis lapponica]
MKAVASVVAAVALFAAGVSAQNFMINTPPNAVECVPTQLTWVAGNSVPPYFLVIEPGGQPGAPALQQYTGLTGTSFTWSTNVTSGQSVGLTLTDSTGQTVQSAAFPVHDGPSTSCLNASGSSSAGSSASSSAAASSGGASSSASTSGSSSGSPTSSHATSSAPSGSSSSSSTTKPNAAVANMGSMGLAGAVGAFVAALLA